MRLLMRGYPVFALAAIILMGGPRAQAQTEITRPVVSEKTCPLKVIEAITQDKHKAIAVVRKPPGKGPFPAIVLLHGGLNQRKVDRLKMDSLRQPTSTRFLAAGYVTVTATFRSRQQDPQTSTALWDCIAIVEHVKKLPEVDAESIVVFGGSGGGSLALELAGETRLAAIAAGEPASVLFTGMMTRGDDRVLLRNMMNAPKDYYSPKLKQFTRKKIGKIKCPVLIAHGDKHPINKINHQIIIPALKKAKKTLRVIRYPDQPHGFYWERNGSPAAGKKFFEDCNSFFKKYLKTQPQPLERSLLRQVPLTRK